MQDLEMYKHKVTMSEQIITDLKKAGSDNMGNLLNMMKQFKERERNTVEEIEKLKQLETIKDDELVNLDVETRSLNDFLDNMNRSQAGKIDQFKEEIDANKKVIRRQDKLIVDLQQRNELTQNTMADT